MEYDVAIPTLNSGKTLEKCLECIIKSVPYGRIIIADSFSKDNTKHIAKKYNCEFHYVDGKLGAARNLLMDLVKTKFFIFIDSDVQVNKKWFEILEAHIDDKTGAINGFGLPDNFLLSNFRKIMLKTKLKFGINQRGFTSNTIIRTKAVKGIKLPDLKRLEDVKLQEAIIKKGWEWKMIPVWCLHMKTGMQIIQEAKSDFFNLAREEGWLKALSKL